ncbi:glycosyltransferase family 2 protein [Candidatus Dojkabacteria bacterium]|nr:glycosyltransferase family 2 protein [Candidatus Dojkabacteria bacterium]
MISIILTAFKESKTISTALKYLAQPKYSGYQEKIEIIQVSPDKATLSAGLNYIKTVENSSLSFSQIKDPGISKPHALNIAFGKAKGEIIVLTDGDVNFEKNALEILIKEFTEKKFDIACGKPVSSNQRNTFMGYISHLMTSAADDKRNKKLNLEHDFFPLSGYALILNKSKFETNTNEKLVLPEDCLVEDAYISYKFYNNNLKLGYIKDSKVKVKFPSTLKDYFRQKKRSTGGYLQLWKYNIVKRSTNSRSIFQEIKYFLYPLKFAKSPLELIWSLAFYPTRLILWIVIWYERKIQNKDFTKTWVRIESTK